MKPTLKIVLPIVVLVLAAIGARALIASRPVVEQTPPEIAPPLVEVIEARVQSVDLGVEASGTVAPRVEASLVPEVSGRVVELSRDFVPGGFFSRGGLLVAVEKSDYEWAAVRARSAVARAELALAREEASAAVARTEWEELGEGDGSPLALRTLQVEEARAALEAARAELEQAETNLSRTEMRAPFDGRVLSTMVDLGQFVSRGVPVGTLFSTEAAEVRLPVRDNALEFLDLGLDPGWGARGKGPAVELRADFAGAEHSWHGRVVRTEGRIDPATRMVHVVAEVRDPYGAGRSNLGLPLVNGMYVTARIAGRSVDDVVSLPRAALRESGDLIVVDDESRVRFRPVELLRVERDRVLIASGLAEGERICVSPLDEPVDGMRVRVASGR